jgi:hypothetical protein
MPPPDHPKIFHITHVENLREIVRAGVLWSDARRRGLGLDCQIVGMATIKERRLRELRVKCHPGTMVGEYVPFYLCPRSIMLYILHMANHPELIYTGGQGPIVHLVADLRRTVGWAEGVRRRWALTDSNAGGRLADFYADLRHLDRVNWEAVAARDFRDPVIQEGKQAEFLIHESFPWELVEEIGVRDAAIGEQVRAALGGAPHQPPIRVEPTWYY